jgi:hypothetical protein
MQRIRQRLTAEVAHQLLKLGIVAGGDRIGFLQGPAEDCTHDP